MKKNVNPKDYKIIILGQDKETGSFFVGCQNLFLYHAKEKDELYTLLQKELKTHKENFIFVDETTGKKLFIQNE